MKKSLHLTHTDIRSDSRILKEMEALVVGGYSVRGLGVASDEGSQKSYADFDAHIQAIQLRSRSWIFFPRTVRHMFSLCELMLKMLPAAIRLKPDVVHCHDTLALPLGVIVKLFTRARLVYDAHELESDRNGLSRLQGQLTLKVEKLLWRFVDALIVVSPSIKTWYNEKIGAKPTAVVLNSPLFKDEDLRQEGYLRERYSIPGNVKIFIYVGILGAGRGIDLITESFKHPDIDSHVVFLGFGELSSQIKQLAKTHSNIHVHDAVPHAQVVPIVKSADYGLCLIQNVSLSDYYCLPNKLFEYCFADIPVLASDFPDMKSLIKEYNIGECCELNIEQVKNAIKMLSDKKTKMIFKDLRPLAWQAQEKKLLELYSILYK